MKKLLTLLGSVGMMATTSATVVACGNGTPKEKTPKENLSAAIESAKKALAEGTKKPQEAKDTLEKAIKEAQKVYENKESSEEDFKTASEKLNKEVESFKELKDESEKTPKENLSAAIESAKKALAEGTKKPQEVQYQLREIIKEAEELLNDAKLNDEKANDMISKINSAVEKLKAAKDVAQPVDKDKLGEAIGEAQQLIERGGKGELITKVLQTALDAAKEVESMWEPTQEEINRATNNLNKFIDIYKNTVVGEDNGYFELQTSIANLKEAINKVNNLETNSAEIVAAKKVQNDAESVRIDATQGEVSRAKSVVDSTIDKIKVADQTDTSKYDQAVKNYHEVVASLVNEKNETVIEQIENLIENTNRKISEEKLRTKEANSVADEINAKVEELKDFEKDLTKEISSMQELVGQMLSLDKEIQEAFENSDHSADWSSISLESESLLKEVKEFSSSLKESDDEHPNKKNINENIESLRTKIEDLNKKFSDLSKF